MRGFGVALIAALSVACGAAHPAASRAPAAVAAPEGGEALFGRRARITYPEFVAEVSYVSERELTWKTTAPDGSVAEGREEPVYRRISEHLHFLSWIERDGFTVSQVIDTKALRVVAFGSFADATSARGNRTGALMEGTLVFEN